MPTPIKQMLQEGQEVRVTMLGPMAHHKMVEIIGLVGGLHGLWVDQEHSGLTHPQIEVLMLACRSAGLEGFVRLSPLDYTTIMRPMEAGAFGVMVAQIRTVEDVHQVVQWAKYPPLGMRGLFRGNHEARYGMVDQAEHVKATNRDRWLCIQIETVESVDCVDEIAAVDGVDTLFVGPGDLAAALGVPGQPMHACCIEALEKVAKAVKNAGKSWGMLPAGLEHAQTCRELGCQMFSFTTEVEAYRVGLEGMKQTYGTFF